MQRAATRCTRKWLSRALIAASGVGAAMLGSGLPASAQEAAQPSTQALAAAAQNPVAAMISLPFQNNTYFGIGPGHDQAANALNIQPVLPFTVGNWNIISRTILPIISLPSITPGLPDVILDAPASGDPFGLGDINETLFLSPAAPSKFIWGVGPSFNLPTATDRFLGTGKFSMGPSAVGLVMPRPWVVGMLVRQLFSVAGPAGRTDVNQTLLQPFVNYNLPGGWYLTSSPIVTADWSASASQRWTVPLGGGVGRIFTVRRQPINVSLQAYGYAATPSLGPRWALRFQVQFLFPR